jgi:hypothetical protein
MTARRKSKTALVIPPTDAARYIELVHWREAQPTIPEKDGQWLKLYTSLLDHDAWGEMDDSARVLIVSLWLYAARTGRYVLPADPAWIWRKIPSLKTRPDLSPLLRAADALGRPTPFLRYCDPQEVQDRESKKRDAKKSREEKREEQSREDGALRSPKEKEKKKRTCAKSKTEQTRHNETEQTQGEHGTKASDENRQEPVQPVNPAKSEVGGPEVKQISPTVAGVSRPAPRPAYPSEPTRMGVEIEKFRYWFDQEAVRFGYEIFHALHLDKIDGPDSKWGEAERGTFTKWLHRHRQHGDFAAAYQHGLHVAKNIGKYQAGQRKPGAIWLNAVNGKSRAPPAARSA